MPAPPRAPRDPRIADPKHPLGLVEWPALALFLGATGLFCGSSCAAVVGLTPAWLSVALNAISLFVLFTVAHDAAHGSISAHDAVTRWLGRLSTVAFAPHSGFPTFRFIHMQHHRFTNYSDGRDPDFYTHTGPRWQLPLRWLTVDLHYVLFYLRQLPKRPRAEVAEMAITWGLALLLAAALIATGYGRDLFVLYVLPQRLAIGFLAWAFDYLPHCGLERHTSLSNRYRATRNLVGAEWLLSVLLLNQNYHLVHHLHPRLPFHRYLAVWRSREADYLAHDPALMKLFARK